MAKNLKLNIKNTQIAQAINLGSLKKAASKKKETSSKEASSKEKADNKKVLPEKKDKSIKEAPISEEAVEHQPRKKARSRSAFAEPEGVSSPADAEAKSLSLKEEAPSVEEAPRFPPEASEPETPAFTHEECALNPPLKASGPKYKTEKAPQEKTKPDEAKGQDIKTESPSPTHARPKPTPRAEPTISSTLLAKKEHTFLKDLPKREKFGPTGKHVKDLLPPKPKSPPLSKTTRSEGATDRPAPSRTTEPSDATPLSDTNLKGKSSKFKEFRDLKPAKRSSGKGFDSRDSRGLRNGDDDSRWRRRKQKQSKNEEDTTIRPNALTVRIPISLKDLAAEMKLKASQLIQKMFMQGVILTLNDTLDDPEMVQLLGLEFGCTITIDTSEEERIQITGKTIAQEISEADQESLIKRAPVIAFMGHVDHGKTSLIDHIRKTNRTASEAGAITQHMGAFMCSTSVGEIAILDTPGHEAFSAMRERGANVTDIIVLVIAGDEGIRQQTIEAIEHAKAASVNIVVAINKCDKPSFDAETVYRQLSEQELLPEVWGGQTITVNCSATTGKGVDTLLDMLALQSDVLELKASPSMRARGTVIESELNKGLGSKATILVQNGTLRKGDALVFEEYWGKVKTMQDEYGKEVLSAGPSHPVEITGLSGLPDAGQEFIVVKNEKEAKEISQKRRMGIKQNALNIKKSFTMEHMFETSNEASKKTLTVILRADVQGSLEALKTALEKIKSSKAELNIIFAEVGEISESDVQLAAASKAFILGFHTAIESKADTMVKELGVQVMLHDIIYHAVDDIKLAMKNLLDKIPQENEKGAAFVKAVFKSSHLGNIAGCQVSEGVINRNHLVRVKRAGEVIFKGTIASLKKVKEDVREVAKGIECGILINGFNGIEANDIIEAYDITYLTQEL